MRLSKKDDPYRSLAGKVRINGGFSKVSTPFAEFKWADFFRDRIAITEIDGSFENAVGDGLKLAKTCDARSLPGYQGPSCH